MEWYKRLYSDASLNTKSIGDQVRIVFANAKACNRLQLPYVHNNNINQQRKTKQQAQIGP